MKVSEQWLRAWVNPAISTEQLVEQLTMAGLEVDAVEPAAEAFTGVVVAEIKKLTSHPDADKLNICEVDCGDEQPVQIVCGAPNVFPGMKAPLAKIGATLPGGIKIKQARLRGQVSFGMLCSACELGLSEDAAGLAVLPHDAPLGMSLRDYLKLDDQIIDIDLTPNRGDCLGVIGIAREIAAINDKPLRTPEFVPVAPCHDQLLPVKIAATDGCARYIGRVIRGINSAAITPLWMQERLRRSGIRSIHPVVDVTNYVLLELGQPMHGFDLRELSGGITVRWAVDGEKLVLLDGQTIELQQDVLMIADDEKSVAMAGIMGGEHSAVADDTTEVFLESAWFDPLAIVGRARRFGLHTDASHRYERGVDPQLQQRAIERATALLVEITGGEPGPLTIAEVTASLPARPSVALRSERLNSVLGTAIDDECVLDIFRRLEMKVDISAVGCFSITPPSYRFDIAIEEDLIEEVARIYGYNRIGEAQPFAPLSMARRDEATVSECEFKDLLASRDYREVVTFSFVDEAKERLIYPTAPLKTLLNPISSELAVMRTSLWQGLLGAMGYNRRHQQTRLRFFESGLTFRPLESGLSQEVVLAGAICGMRHAQGLYSGECVDFYDLKADVESILGLSGAPDKFAFVADQHPALHPGQSAKIIREGHPVGWLGAVHPTLLRAFDLPTDTFMFEIKQAAITPRTLPSWQAWSRFPQSDRDIAVVVNDTISAAEVLAAVMESGTSTLKNARIFDIYRGKGVDSGRKSIALGLIFGEPSRTLNDEEVNAAVALILAALQQRVGATLRE